MNWTPESFHQKQKPVMIRWSGIMSVIKAKYHHVNPTLGDIPKRRNQFLCTLMHSRVVLLMTRGRWLPIFLKSLLMLTQSKLPDANHCKLQTWLLQLVGADQLALSMFHSILILCPSFFSVISCTGQQRWKIYINFTQYAA